MDGGGKGNTWIRQVYSYHYLADVKIAQFSPFSVLFHLFCTSFSCSHCSPVFLELVDEVGAGEREDAVRVVLGDGRRDLGGARGPGGGGGAGGLGGGRGRRWREVVEAVDDVGGRPQVGGLVGVEGVLGGVEGRLELLLAGQGGGQLLGELFVLVHGGGGRWGGEREMKWGVTREKTEGRRVEWPTGETKKADGFSFLALGVF